MLKISTEKPENCRLSDSFKDNVRGLIKLNATYKHSQKLKDVDSLPIVGVKVLICEFTAANQRVLSSVFFVTSYILVLR